MLAAVGGTAFGLVVTGNGSSPPARASQVVHPPPVATRSSSGGSTGALLGPRTGVDLGTVAGGLNIVRASAPTGWQMGPAPWQRASTPQSDDALAQCLGLPVSHVGMLTANAEPGGPAIADSGWFDSPDGVAALESFVVLTQSVSTQVSDLAALMQDRAGSCIEGWFASIDQSGDQIVGVPKASEAPVAVVPGERAAAFQIAVVTRTTDSHLDVNEEIVVVGAGRVEVGLLTESVGAEPAASIEATELQGLERRLRSIAAS